MEQFTVVTGIAAPLLRDNIDTDLLIPSREMTSPGREGYGEKLLAPWRYLPSPPEQRIENPDFVLNQAPFRQATILIAGRNFGSGSSREAAVWAVRQFGFRCVIAASFGAIFQNNCYRNGVLPLVLPVEQVCRLAEAAESDETWLTVDLRSCEVTGIAGVTLPFHVPPNARAMLLEGLDPIGVTLKRVGAIRAFQENDRRARPWIWDLETLT